MSGNGLLTPLGTRLRPSVAHLTSVHQSDDQRIFHKECRTLAEAGYAVTLISTTGKDETISGVRLRPVSPARRRADRMARVVFRMFCEAVRAKADLYHFHDPELITAGLLLKLRGRQVVYDVHEDLPKQVLSKEWVPRHIRPFIARMCTLLEAIAGLVFDAVVAATPSIARRFPSTKTVVVQNFPMKSEFSDTLVPYQGRDEKVAYIGGLTPIRGISEVIEAMDALPASCAARLLLAGVFSPKGFEDEVRRLGGWRKVDFRGWLSRHDINTLLSETRVGLVTFHHEPNHLDAYPTKLFEYMAAGIPVVASDFPLWREIVDAAGCGLLVNPLQPTEIAAAIQWLLEHPQEAEAMGQRGLQAVYKRYNWEAEANKLLACYRTLVGDPS